MKTVLIFSKNYENYTSGFYHQDIIDSFHKLSNVYIYGPGYPNYSIEDCFDDVLAKLSIKLDELDLIVFSTSWDDDGSIDNVDPHPNIEVSKIKTPKVYFLNKEYKKLNERFDFIKKQKFDLVCTVHPSSSTWESELGVPFLNLPFGISLDRFKDFGYKKQYDFSFTGGLHSSHTDLRFLVKKEIFKSNSLKLKSNKGIDGFLRNPIRHKYQKYKIYWAEWGSRDFTFRSLLPTGKRYGYFMNRTKVFLNTPSAIGIFNTRFFELMATKSLILCPESDTYGKFLKDNHNCLMFKKDLSNFQDKLVQSIEDESFRKAIITNAYTDVSMHSYDERIKSLLSRF